MIHDQREGARVQSEKSVLTKNILIVTRNPLFQLVFHTAAKEIENLDRSFRRAFIGIENLHDCHDEEPTT